MNVIIDGVEYAPIRKPLTFVEGKPVFVGDELYDEYERCGPAERFEDGILYVAGRGYGLKCWSWNPPKPTTVMVELRREDAEWWHQGVFCSDRQVRMQAACRKALEKA